MDESINTWAAKKVRELLQRLVALIGLGRELPPDPWPDTRPDVRREDKG